MNRRGFLKFAAGGTVGLVASPIIWNTLYDAVYWTQSWGWIPRLQRGEETFIPTVSKLCPSGTGLRVWVVDDRPVRTLGNPDNAMSQGGLTALAAAEAQLMVTQARLKTPLRRTSDGAHIAITWDEAETLLKENMVGAKGSVACISGDTNGTINEVFSGLLNAAGSSDFYLMPGEEQPALKAWSLMGGQGRPGYDLENSDFILAIGANLLETWGTVARNRHIFGVGHPAGEEPTLKIAYAGAVQNNTASGADWWLPIKPGTEMAFALGVAHLLIKNGKTGFAPGLSGLDALVAEYTPEKVAALTGVNAQRLTDVVTALAAASKPLVIVGTEFGAGGGAGPVMAGMAVNMLLGRVGQEGNMQDLPFPTKVVPQSSDFRTIMERDLVAWTTAVASGSTQAPSMLLLYEANPLYALPPSSGMRAVLESPTTYKVAMASFMSETCEMCDLVLPAAMGLERFDDVYTPYGSGQVNYSIAHPVVAPMYQARPMGELLIALAQELNVDLGVDDMPGLIERKARSLGANFKTMMETGEVVMVPRRGAFSVPVYNMGALQAVASGATVPGQDAPVQVAPVVVLGMGTPQTAIPPFATRIITEYQLKGTYSVAQMNAATADKLGLRKGDRVNLSNDNNAITAVVDIFEGVLPDCVAMSAGLGHTAFDEFSQNKGANIMTLTSVSQEPGTGLSVWGQAGVTAVRA